MRSFISDIRKFLRQSEEDYETNQGSIGMKYLFRGFIIKVQTGVNFSQTKYVDCNHIIVKHYLLYYSYCWEDRNNKLHDRVMQRERVVNWYEKEKRKARQSQYPQVKKCMEKREVNLETLNTEYIRRWTYSLRVLKKNAEKYQGTEDIRGYFNEV